MRPRIWCCGRKRSEYDDGAGSSKCQFPILRLYRKLLADGRIIDRDLSHYNTSRVVFRPAGMSAEELLHGFLWMYAEFYSWRRIAQRLPETHAQRTAYLLFNVLYRKLGPAVAAIGKLGVMGALSRLARLLSYG